MKHGLYFVKNRALQRTRLNGGAKQTQMIAVMKNLGLAGAMLMTIARGPGPMSTDKA